MTTTPRRNIHAELKAWGGDTPPRWEPGVGDSIVGELIRYSRGRARYGPAWVAHVREEQSGELLAVWLFRTTLLDAFKRERPEPGERIGLRRLKDGTGAHGSYRRFSLIVEREGGESVPDFDAIEATADDGDAERGNGFDLRAPNPFD